jgi:hypothetical protein
LILHCLASAGRAELRILPPRELGEIRAGLPVTERFELFNTGPEQVEIVEVRSGCGCLTWQVEPKVLAAHASGALTVHIRTLGEAAGHHTWRAALRYRQGSREAEIEATIEGDVVTEISVQPASLTMISGGQMSQVITLRDLRSEHLTITQVQPTSPALKARVLRQERDPGGTWLAQIQLDADFPIGRHTAMLNIYTNDRVYAHVQVPVTIVREEAHAILASPGQILLEIQPGQPLPPCLVRLRAAGPVQIEKVIAEHPAVTCRWAPGPENQATLRIQIDRSLLAGANLESVIRVRVISPMRELVTIPVTVRTP